MEDVKAALNELFAPNAAALQPEVMGELQSILRLHSISPQELFYKWESYSLKMGGDDLRLDLRTARDLKKDINDTLERESRSKAQARGQEKRVAATPRAAANGGDVFGMLDSLVPNTPRPGSTIKRRANFETPTSMASKGHAMSSPGDFKSPQTSNGASAAQSISFAERPHAGEIAETLNSHIPLPEEASEPPAEPRFKLKANTEISKFGYKTMAMKLSEASEILDDRIEEFLGLIQSHHNLDDSAFGNPTVQSTSEIVAVGRIASDTGVGRLNAASLVLETSRRSGAGLRVPLRVDSLPNYHFFPGQIVAVRGRNASGEFFTVTEILSIPPLPLPATSAADLEAYNSRLLLAPADGDSPRPLTILLGAGPYTTDTELNFSPLHHLLDTAAALHADALILSGPFLDAEHPLIRTGDFDLPPTASANPDTLTLTDAFKHFISNPLHRFTQQLPTCTTLLIPSVRDTFARHAAWPQDRLPPPLKRDLGLPKSIHVLTNPCTFSLNELLLGTTSLDILDMLRREDCAKAAAPPLDRAARALLDQRSFCPLFPPTARESLPAPTPAAGGAAGGAAIKPETNDADPDDEDAAHAPFLPLGAMLDTAYLKLADWLNVKPDLLVLPSALPAFVRVLEGVLVVNPGTAAKRRGFGTFARVTVGPAVVDGDDGDGEGDGQGRMMMLPHRLFERARVDIFRL